MFGKSGKQQSFGAYASPWIVIGASLILACVVFVMAFFNINREKRYMSQLLSEKGAALIKAFEAGTRAGMRGGMGGGRFDLLLEETALQPGVLYIAITDVRGRTLFQSGEVVSDAQFVSSEAMKELDPNDAVSWRVVTDNAGDASFMVYRKFNPMAHGVGKPPHGRMKHYRGRGPAKEQGKGEEPHCKKEEKYSYFCAEACGPGGTRLDMEHTELVVFVGLDIAPVKAARDDDFRNTLISAAFLLLLGLGGLVSLFWAHNYRISRRLLQDTRALAGEVVANLPVGLVSTDKENKVSFFNTVAESLIGLKREEAQGRAVEDVLPGQLLELVPRDGQSKAVLEKELECVFQQEAAIPLSVSAVSMNTEGREYIGKLFILKDLRELRKLQEEVRRAEKLAAVGNLAAGVAHEIRNPLSSIRGYATYFGGKFEKGSDESESAKIMVQEVDRLNRVISELLEFARPSDLKTTDTPLNMLVERSLRLIKHDAEVSKVRVVFEADEAVPEISMDPDRFTQALLNILLNGVQSMEQGGELTVRTGVQGQMAFVEVQDQGKGIAPEQRSKIFDPYFTTKGKGAGLGLAIVHKIVEAHGGVVDVESMRGKGSMFRVLLPYEIKVAK